MVSICVLPLFDRTPVSSNIDYIFWWKSVNQWILGSHRYFCWRQSFGHFQHGGPVQYGRESARKSRAGEGNASLDNCMHREQHHHQGEGGDLRWGLREVSSCGFAEPYSKEILLRLRQLSVCEAFHWRQDFVDAYILSAPIFCCHKYFVGANILSAPNIYWYCLG